jgi:hypothetical protein
LHGIFDAPLFGVGAIEELLALPGLKIGAIPADIGARAHNGKLQNILKLVFGFTAGITSTLDVIA